MVTMYELIGAFGGVEDDQGYTRLVDSFADDAVYYDPFFGPQVDTPAIRSFMAHMEDVVPARGARHGGWQTAAGINCGHAQWNLVALPQICPPIRRAAERSEAVIAHKTAKRRLRPRVRRKQLT